MVCVDRVDRARVGRGDVVTQQLGDPFGRLGALPLHGLPLLVGPAFDLRLRLACARPALFGLARQRAGLFRVTRDAGEQFFRVHCGPSFQCVDRVLHGPGEPVEPVPLREESFVVFAECGHPVGVAVEDLADPFQPQSQLPQYEDFLQPEQLLRFVVAVAALPGERGREQADVVVVPQGARRDAGHPRDVGDRVGHELDARG
ncbi:hypothetical protein LY13_000547 [Prauserella aidingensis]|nr:hypothetical protein [Prauserella aidingensis]